MVLTMMKRMDSNKMKIRNCVLIEPFTCKKTDSVTHVAKKLRDITLKHVFVVDEHDHPVGIISMTDINNRVVAEGLDPKMLKAENIMSKPIDLFDLNDDIESSCKKMIGKKHVMGAVTDNGKMKGIITVHQLIKNLEKK